MVLGLTVGLTVLALIGAVALGVRIQARQLSEAGTDHTDLSVRGLLVGTLGAGLLAFGGIAAAVVLLPIPLSAVVVALLAASIGVSSARYRRVVMNASNRRAVPPSLPLALIALLLLGFALFLWGYLATR
jgi:hypothetical protein